MGRLVIAHHKSYHPYRRDNIEKVRKDEEEARQKEAREEGRMLLADSEARLELLRERAGLQQSDKRGNSGRATADQVPTPSTSRHINLFEESEHNAAVLASRVAKKADPAESEKGVPLAPSAKDLRPWYSEKARLVEQQQEIDDDRRRRDAMRKSMHDPLASITHQLSARASTSGSSRHIQQPPSRTPTTGASEVDARIARESSERQRALELIRRKKRELDGSETPGAMHGARGSYGDVFNRKEVEEAHRFRERRWDSWDRERKDSRSHSHRR